MAPLTRPVAGWLSAAFCAALLPLASCAGRPKAPAPLDHDHGTAMRTLQIQGKAITPAPDLTIPLYSAVCWLNATGEGRSLEVRLDRSPGVCGSCATILGFGVTSEGRAMTSARVAPSSVALICFHEEGEFRYSVDGTGTPLAGTIRVVAPKGSRP